MIIGLYIYTHLYGCINITSDLIPIFIPSHEAQIRYDPLMYKQEKRDRF